MLLVQKLKTILQTRFFNMTAVTGKLGYYQKPLNLS